MSAFPVKKSDLEIVIKNFDIKDGILFLYVPYPKNYPDTTFKKNNCKNQIGYLQMDFSEVDKGYISLDFFFVHSSKSSMTAKYATKEEIELSKGLGKKMLCYAINLLINNDIINIETTILRLNAGGGYCASEEDINNIIRTFTEEKINEYIDKYINSTDKNEILESSLIEKAKIICIAQDNIKLVNYYQQYGLNPLVVPPEKVDLTFIPMAGYVHNVLKKCENISEKDTYTHKESKVEEINDEDIDTHIESKVEEINDEGNNRREKSKSGTRRKKSKSGTRRKKSKSGNRRKKSKSGNRRKKSKSGNRRKKSKSRNRRKSGIRRKVKI